MKLVSKSLYVVSTPIGNLDDITLRAIKVLKNSDIILCEDTRRSLKLLNHLKTKKKLISYHKYNEKKKISEIIQHINQGKILSLISDAGTPLLSDPGKLLLNECIKNNINVFPIPGSSSIITAMSISGFSDKFLFYGFLPKTEKELNKTLLNLKNEPHSLVFFSPAKKINFYISFFKTHFSGRKLMIAKELTKLHETIYRGEIDNFSMFKTQIKGEITLVISEPAIKTKQLDKKIILNKAKKYLKTYSLKDTVNLIFEKEKINKKEIYQICLDIKNAKNN
tara:strand:+ start:2801 stop:3640 length:840 start_codon:yes stop_codon:yes gene_type:complete